MRWPQEASATGQPSSAFQNRSQPINTASNARPLPSLFAAARPATVPGNLHLPAARLNSPRTRSPPSASQPAQAGDRLVARGARGEANGAPEVSQTVVAAANSILHAHAVTPPISNSAFTKSRKRIPKVQQTWQAPRTAKHSSHYTLASATSNNNSSSNQRDVPAGAQTDAPNCGSAAYQPQQDLRQRLYASRDARERVLVSNNALGTAAKGGTFMHVDAHRKRFGNDVAMRTVKPRRLADLNTGLETSLCAAGARPIQVADMTLRQRQQAPLGGIVPPAPAVAGRLSSRRKHRRAVNYTMYNDQRFAEAARRKRELAVRQMQAAAAARAMAGTVQSGVAKNPPPRDVIGKW